MCELRRLGSMRVSQSRAISQTWTKPETPGLGDHGETMGVGT